MSSAAFLLVALTVAGADADVKEKPKPAQVTATAELACLHCTFGEGDGCAVCLKLDDKTPLLLAGKAAKACEADRFTKKVVIAVGTLSVNKDKRMVLTSDEARGFTDKDKDTAPAAGEVRISGAPCCAKCDLDLTKECRVGLRNAGVPIVFDGKLGAKCAEEFAGAMTATAVGKLTLDKDGVFRLDVTKLELPKK